MIYPVFDIVPDFSAAPDVGTVFTVERAALGVAPETAFFPQTQAERTITFNFTLTSAAECAQLKQFFRDRGGRTDPFYLPSWRNELPFVSGAAGQSVIEVGAELEFADTPDGHGRALFIYQPGQALFVSEVIDHENGDGAAVINLGSFLPFTVDATSTIGYLDVVRHDDEELQYAHLSAEIATSTLHFRTVRQWLDSTNTYTVERLDVTGGEATALGFVSAEASLASGALRDQRVAAADGYAAWVNPDGVRFKVTATPDDINIPDGTGVISNLTPTPVLVEHLAFSIDSDGGEMFAWQISTTQFRLARDPADPIYLDIDGLDPILTSNFGVDEVIVSQTNFLYYRKAGDNRLFVRKGTGFGTEYTAAVLPVRPVKLMRAYKDGRTIKLELLDANMRLVTLTSAPYPEL